jgi:CPA2 family monovalent cation:H+ antiporter-2
VAVAVEMGLLLGAGGEFAFVSLGMAAELHLIDPDTATFTLTVTSAETMALIPLVSHLARRFRIALARRRRDAVRALDAADRAAATRHRRRHGRVGKMVCAC